MLACFNGHKDINKIILDYSDSTSIDMNARCKGGLTVFIGACIYGREDVVKFLIHNSAIKNIILTTKTQSGVTAFIRACGKGDASKAVIKLVPGIIQFFARLLSHVLKAMPMKISSYYCLITLTHIKLI